MSFRTRITGLGAALAAGAAVGALAIAPAGATTTRYEWNLASGGADASGRTFTGLLTLSSTMVYNGAPFTVNCVNVTGMTYTAPDPTPHAPALSTMSIQVTPPATFPSGSCTDSFSGGPVNVATSGAAWTIEFTTPDEPADPTLPAHFTGTLTGKVKIPAGAVTAVLKGLPSGLGSGACTLVGPTSAMTVSGTYDAATGVATKTGGATLFSVNNAGCPLMGTPLRLQSASATLWEDIPGSPGDHSRHPDLIWVP